MSGGNNEPGDVVISDPQKTDIISPVIDQRPRTAGAGPLGGAPQLDEGRPGELSYLRIIPSYDRLLRKVKSFPHLFSEYFYLEYRRHPPSAVTGGVNHGQTGLTQQQRQKYQPHG